MSALTEVTVFPQPIPPGGNRMRRNHAGHLALLSLRIGLGLLFLVGYIGNSKDPAFVQSQVAGSGLLPPPLVGLYAAGLPYWELAFGLCFLLGLLTRITGFAAALAVVSYTVYLTTAPVQQMLGPLAIPMLAHNITFISATLALAMAGAGAYSLDALLARGQGARWGLLTGTAAPRRA